jgi:subfamily B ATP-binding cassette protein MsbA
MANPPILTSGLPLLEQLALIFLAIAVLQGISGYTGTVFSFNLLKQLQTDFFDKASHLPLAYFQQQSAGEFFTKFNSDIAQAQRFFADFLPGVGRELITAIAVTAVLFYFCPATLTFAALGIVGLTTLLVSVLNRIMGYYARAQRATWSDIQRVFDETIQGIDTIKLLAAEEQR